MSEFLQRYSIIALLLVIGCSLSYIAFTAINYYESQYSQQQFQAKFQGKVTSLSQAASAINKVFLATKAVLDINHELTRGEFAKLITKDFLLDTGMQGIEWAPSIAIEDIPSFENEVYSGPRDRDSELRYTSLLKRVNYESEVLHVRVQVQSSHCCA